MRVTSTTHRAIPTLMYMTIFFFFFKAIDEYILVDLYFFFRSILKTNYDSLGALLRYVENRHFYFTTGNDA